MPDTMAPSFSAFYEASTWILPLLIAIPFHEAAHGFVAHRLGDDTAWRLGRVTFNPLKHVDRFGTIVLPALLILTRAPFLFGYAKPVPVDFRALRPPRIGSVLVAAAGPAMNLVLALVAAWLVYLAIQLPPSGARWGLYNLRNAIELNIVLAVFNMLPIPPLDGGRVAVGVLPRALGLPLARLEPYGMLILIGLMVLPSLAAHGGVFIDPLGWLIGAPVQTIIAW
ncbi:MAG: site-2 protease family protein, partial [Alphaproteobacteria bacterium]|nr:site-2 protease family protein [Alphaproteobacteria bacterium]